MKKKRKKVRIVLVNHFPLVGSGSGIYVANIAKGLEKKDIKYALLCQKI